MMTLTVGLSLVTTLLFGLWVWMKYRHSYWQRMKVPFIKPDPVFGNFKRMFCLSCNPPEQLSSLYFDDETRNKPILGIYIMDRPGLLVREPDLIKSILVRDFNKFCDRTAETDRHGDVLGTFSLSTVRNPEWKQLRAMVSPVFTRAKLKEMFPLINEVGKALDKYCSNLPFDSRSNSCIAEMKEISALYTMDVISSVAYGVQANTLTDLQSEFRTKGRQVTKLSFMRTMELYAIFFVPKFVRILRCKSFGKVATKFLRSTVNSIIQERIESGKHRNDLIDILIAFKKSVEGDEHRKHLSQDDVLIAQAAVFFVAGFDTTSSAIAFTLYELAKSPEVQKRLRQEIKEALIRHNGEVSNDMLKELEYLEMVINEGLRLYPPIAFLHRECKLSDNEERYSLAPYSSFRVPHKMPVYIPISSIHRDPKYHPNPDEFNPERFSFENKANIQPMTFLPFGGGPRGCLGQRLGLIKTKIGLIYLLRNHYVTTCERSHEQMKFEPRSFFPQPMDGIYCKIVKDPLCSV